MKILNKTMQCIAFLLIIAMQFAFIPLRKAYAATTPAFGQAASFGILSSTYTNTAAGTTINGDLGYTTGPAVAPTVNGTTYTALTSNILLREQIRLLPSLPWLPRHVLIHFLMAQ